MMIVVDIDFKSGYWGEGGEKSFSVCRSVCMRFYVLYELNFDYIGVIGF